MLLLNPDPLISVTFSTPTPDSVNYVRLRGGSSLINLTYIAPALAVLIRLLPVACYAGLLLVSSCSDPPPSELWKAPNVATCWSAIPRSYCSQVFCSVRHFLEICDSVPGMCRLPSKIGSP